VISLLCQPLFAAVALPPPELQLLLPPTRCSRRCGAPAVAVRQPPQRFRRRSAYAEAVRPSTRA
jgi:hypothetical protein